MTERALWPASGIPPILEWYFPRTQRYQITPEQKNRAGFADLHVTHCVPRGQNGHRARHSM